MPQQKWNIQAPDGKVIAFPDNFSEQDVNREMMKMYPSGKGSGDPNSDTSLLSQKYTGGNAKQSTAADVMDAMANFGENAYQGAKGAVTGAADMAKDLWSNPNWLTYRPANERPSTFQKFVTQPAEAEGAKAKQAFGQGRYSESAGHGLAATLPVVGPWAAGLGEQAGTGDVSGAAGQLTGGLLAGKVGGHVAGMAADLPKTAMDFTRRATSLNEVTKAGAGVYQGKIQPLIQTLRGAIQNEGANTIQQAIEADKKATTVQGRGTISPSTAVAESAMAIEQTGHQPSAQTRTLLNRLNNSSFLTLEDAKNLRSDFGSAASKADRGGQAKLGKVLWTAYDELGEGMKGRIKELQGTTEPFEHYNNEFKAYYELNKGIAGSMQDSIMDRHEAIPKLKEFRDADLTEIKAQGKKYGMDPTKFDEAQQNARAVAAAHDSLSGKMSKSVYRLALGGGVAGATAISVYAAAHGAGLYGLAPLLGASYVASKVAGVPDQMETGRLLRKLGVDPDKFQVRTQVEGPKSFTYPDQDQVYSAPSGGSGAPTSPSAIDDNTTRLLEALKNIKPETPKAGMDPVAMAQWQKSAFGEKGIGDPGAKVRAANPEPTRSEVKAGQIKRIRAK